MRYEYLTPHQFEEIQPFIDTLLIQSWSGLPLDIAAPHFAAKWISEQLAVGIFDRFRGRMAMLDLGLSLPDLMPVDTVLQALTHQYGYPVKHGILLCDRSPADAANGEPLSIGDTQWLILDWYRWYKSRVEAARLPDLLVYMSCASGNYLYAPERRNTGIDDEAAAKMAGEGRRLMASFVDWASNQLMKAWSNQNAIN